MTIKLLSLNIEQDKHWPAIEALLSQTRPDVICLQELFIEDFWRLREQFGWQGEYVPRLKYLANGRIDGIAIFSRFPIDRAAILDYDLGQGEIPELAHVHSSRPRSVALVLDLTIDKQKLSVATTHFTWSNLGRVTGEQLNNMQLLLKKLGDYERLVIAGDFNSPRGDQVYGLLETKYHSHIPTLVSSTIDGALHRAGPLPYVVDGLFTTANIQVGAVQLHSGVSDHLAITAELSI